MVSNGTLALFYDGLFVMPKNERMEMNISVAHSLSRADKKTPKTMDGQAQSLVTREQGHLQYVPSRRLTCLNRKPLTTEYMMMVSR